MKECRCDVGDGKRIVVTEDSSGSVFLAAINERSRTAGVCSMNVGKGHAAARSLLEIARNIEAAARHIQRAQPSSLVIGVPE